MILMRLEGGQMAMMSKWPTGEFRFFSLCHLGVTHDTPNQPCITKRVSPVSESDRKSVV